jgi:hypothetical protein
MNKTIKEHLYRLVGCGYTIGYCEEDTLTTRIVLKKRYKAWIFEGMTDSVLINYLERF